MDLLAAMTPRRTGERTLTWDVPGGWEQGKGAYGGLVAGAAILAAEQVVADPERPLRALTAALMAPARAVPTVLEVTELRRGSSVTVAAVALRQGAELVAHAVATFGRTRDDAGWTTLAPPALPADAPVLPIGPPQAPAFTRHFELRPATGLPFAGRVEEVTGWVRPRAPGGARGAAYLAACVDVFWPVALVAERAPRPMATLTFTLQVADLVVDDQPLAYRARALAAGGGYVPELRELWSADGRLLAVNPQTFALSR